MLLTAFHIFRSKLFNFRLFEIYWSNLINILKNQKNRNRRRKRGVIHAGTSAPGTNKQFKLPPSDRRCPNQRFLAKHVSNEAESVEAVKRFNAQREKARTGSRTNVSGADAIFFARGMRYIVVGGTNCAFAHGAVKYDCRLRDDKEWICGKQWRNRIATHSIESGHYYYERDIVV